MKSCRTCQRFEPHRNPAGNVCPTQRGLCRYSPSEPPPEWYPQLIRSAPVWPLEGTRCPVYLPTERERKEAVRMAQAAQPALPGVTP